MQIGFQSKCSNISAEGLHFSAFHSHRLQCKKYHNRPEESTPVVDGLITLIAFFCFLLNEGVYYVINTQKKEVAISKPALARAP